MSEKKQTKDKTIYEVLHDIQVSLKAPKGQTNKFGGYKYRNCEDILEAVKPLLPEEHALILYDEIVDISGRIYVKATASLTGNKGTGLHEVSSKAYAREPLTKKGMDESQITGAASSYARKYALNGLFCIDDTKDADSKDNTEKPQAKSNAKDAQTFNPITDEEHQGLFNDMSHCKTHSRLKEIQVELGKQKSRMDTKQYETLTKQYTATKARLDNMDLESNMDKAAE